MVSEEQYLRNFAAAKDQKKIGEATPSYLRSRRAPAALRAFSPDAQIIIMLRNPVDLMYSLYCDSVYDTPASMVSFEAALKADATRTDHDSVGYRQFTDFPEQITRYFEVFGRENVHIIVYDDLKTDPEGVFRDVLRFLEVDLGCTPTFAVVGASRQVRSAWLQRTVRYPPRALRRVGHALVPRSWRPRIRNLLLDANRTRKPMAPMDPELRKRLQAEFQPKVVQLSMLLSRDLSGWCRD